MCPAELYLQWGTGDGNGHRLDSQSSSGALDKVGLFSERFWAPVARVWPAGHRLPIQGSEKQVYSDLLSPSGNPLQELSRVQSSSCPRAQRSNGVNTKRVRSLGAAT